MENDLNYLHVYRYFAMSFRITKITVTLKKLQQIYCFQYSYSGTIQKFLIRCYEFNPSKLWPTYPRSIIIYILPYIIISIDVYTFCLYPKQLSQSTLLTTYELSIPPSIDYILFGFISDPFLKTKPKLRCFLKSQINVKSPKT